MLLQTRAPGNRRRGVILLVVLAMITLMAIFGITFVMYADASATSARIYREAQTISTYGRISSLTITDATLAWESFLGQLLYDVNDDTSGIRSVMRGHSLGRTQYGWNPPATGASMPPNDRPWTGTGRLNEAVTVNGVAINTQQAFNYQYQQASGGPPANVRDPGRIGVRTDPTQAPNPITGDLNTGSTYPDQNNMFLAMQDPATGQILVPSYHREWLQGPLGAGNPLWTSADGAYRLMRPRPADHMGFPAVADATGDVKQLDTAPGGNDSIWLDFNSPVKVGPDGRKYKCMVAPLVLPLDGRIDLQTGGNIRGPGNAHASNQGWGPWEVALRHVLNEGTAPNEWQQVFTGIPGVRGKYGATGLPRGTGVPGGTTLGRRFPVDFNGVDDPPAALALSGPFTFPGLSGLRAHQMFPDYPTNGYGNAVPVETTTDGTNGGTPNHPSIYNVFRPFQDITTPANSNRNFLASEMAAILRLQNLGGEGMPSDLLRLLPVNLTGGSAQANGTNAAYRRNLVTTMSYELDRPSGPPHLWDPTAAATKYTFSTAAATPDGWFASGAPIPFQAVDAATRALAPPAGSDYDPATWKAKLPAFKIDLKRKLENYPFPDATGKFDAAGLTTARTALLDRQNLAKEIFDRLMLVTGAMDAATALTQTGAASSPEFRAVRWLAQHAVNLVDYIDNDEYSTPFQFHTGHWVFGVEAPRLVMNEYYAQWDNIRGQLGAGPSQGGGNYQVNVWVELHNPMASVPATEHPEAGAARLHNGTWAIYRLRLAQTPSANIRVPENDRGAFDHGSDSGVVSTVVDDWGATDATRLVQPGLAAFSGADNSNAGFYVVGPNADYGAPLAAADPNLTARATHTSAQLSYPIPVAQDPTATNAEKPALFLEKLANPYLPPQNDPAQADYNPYITVDYNDRLVVEDGRLFDVTGAIVPPKIVTDRQAYGKFHPLGGQQAMWLAQDPSTPPANQPKNSMFRHNSKQSTAPTHPDATAGQTIQVPFSTFVHIDRVPVSLGEILHASGVRPHELTQTFTNTTPAQRFAHRMRWGQEETKLYRLLDHLTVGPWGGGTDVNGRIPGRVNVNAIWDRNVFRALCDAAAANQFTAAEVDAVYDELIASRSPDQMATMLGVGQVPGANSRPFQPYSWGLANTDTDPLGAAPPNGPPGRGLAHTLYRPARTKPAPALPIPGTVPATASDLGQQRMLEADAAFDNTTYPGGQPQRRFELMTKVHSQLTTRSNTFAVWATVGFFEVMDDTSSPVKLGPEISWPNLGVVRHRMFALIDRSQMQSWPTLGNQSVPLCRASAAITGGLDPTTRLPMSVQFTLLTQNNQAVGATVGVGVNAVVNPNTGRSWLPLVGNLLTFEPDSDNEETVEVTAVAPAGAGYVVTASFNKSHPANCAVINRGNPGPWTVYDPRRDSAVVPYHIVFE